MGSTTNSAKVKRSLIGGAVLASLSAVTSLSFASEPVTPNVSKPNTSVQQPDVAQAGKVAVKPVADRSGAKRFGKASFYANFFAGRKMADGKIMDPHTNNAASRTLPLGTTAKVTNLQTGKSAVVVIQDRGPYVDGRIVDLSPATAQQIGINKRDGIAKVTVTPIAVPMPDGRVKLGEAASDPQVAVNLSNSDRNAGQAAGEGW